MVNCKNIWLKLIICTFLAKIGGSILLLTAFTTTILISIMYLKRKCQHACFDAAVTDYPNLERRLKKTNYDDISISINVNDKMISNSVCVTYG